MVSVVCVTTGNNHNTKDIEDEQDDEDAEESVPIENESYVNFRKRMEKKTEIKAEEVLQENKKLCREFRRKAVTPFTRHFTHLANSDSYRELYLYVCNQKNTF